MMIDGIECDAEASTMSRSGLSNRRACMLLLLMLWAKQFVHDGA